MGARESVQLRREPTAETHVIVTDGPRWYEALRLWSTRARGQHQVRSTVTCHPVGTKAHTAHFARSQAHKGGEEKVKSTGDGRRPMERRRSDTGPP
ncbi:hypothetical protein PtA15_4A809 [Puccinia triticina]|uniref:Uncharacterized protein n=1 Tax=Puccinia triticina TaxID=208348 RepID=A0ABY7CJQ2_9BASI|nr:uncharacterized protein PtA15_4A809 [Puccinia triticina]WAQ84356.1 hypothetical protein PtA15_4A809 [Puccinia triticina]